MVNMYKALLGIWVANISLGFLYKLGGDAYIIIILLILCMAKKKISINIPFIISLLCMSVFIGIKLMETQGYIPISDYHSSLTVIKNNVLVMALLFEINIWTDNESGKLIWRLFNLFYYFSIISSSLILIFGDNYYRNGAEKVPLLLAPQFYLIYAIVLTALLTYDLTMISQNKSKNILLILLNGIYVIAAGYTTQMLFWVFGICLAVYFSAFPKGRKRVIVFVVFIAMIFIMLPLLPAITRFINSTFFASNYEVSKRLTEIEGLLRGQGLAAGDLSIRIGLAQTSYNTFQIYPFWGIPFGRYNLYGNALNVGGHCEWIDSLARYGIFGAVVWGIYLALGLRGIQQKKAPNVNINKVLLFLLATYGFFNPIIKPYLIIIYFISVTFVSNQCSVARTKYMW
ncbi:hypothetical protein D7X48_10365 [bacterium D16-50]|jgi:hypothetical protein|nr:hypothetical protein D7X48_10365 [bacterium D16-50]